jgi:sec-independent protein translocase protein TatA
MSLGVTEIILIIVVIVLLFGARRIPEIAKALGRASHEYKKAKDEIKKESDEFLKEAEKHAANEDKLKNENGNKIDG